MLQVLLFLLFRRLYILILLKLIDSRIHIIKKRTLAEERKKVMNIDSIFFYFQYYLRKIKKD